MAGGAGGRIGGGGGGTGAGDIVPDPFHLGQQRLHIRMVRAVASPLACEEASRSHGERQGDCHQANEGHRDRRVFVPKGTVWEGGGLDGGRVRSFPRADPFEPAIRREQNLATQEVHLEVGDEGGVGGVGGRRRS